MSNKSEKRLSAYNVIEIVADKKHLNLLAFLKGQKTRTLKKDNTYIFIYFEPLGIQLVNMNINGLLINVLEETRESEYLERGFQIIENTEKAILGFNSCLLLARLLIERHRDSGFLPLAFDGWLFNYIVDGIYTKKECFFLLLAFGIHGYSFEETMNVFSVATRKKELTPYFLRVAKELLGKEGI